MALVDIKNKIEDRISKLEKLSLERAKVEGLLEQAMETLKGMGLNSLAEAEAELAKREKALEEAEEQASKLIIEFDEKYGMFL